MEPIHLSDYLDQNAIDLDLGAGTKDAVLEKLVGLLNTDPESKNIALELVRSRESLGSTGIGKEVAIPHSRTLSVPRLKALVARSRKGIDWGARDKKPVKLFFVVAAPPQDRSNDYLPLLGTLVSAMQQANHRDALVAAKGWEQVREILEEALRA